MSVFRSKVLWSVIVVVTGQTVQGQGTARSHVAIAAGPNLAFGTNVLAGVHLQVHAESAPSGAVSVRIEGLALASGTATAQPSCVAGVPRCDSYSTPYPAALYAASLSLVAPLAGRLHGLAGVGAYHGGGYKSLSERYGTTSGALLGIGLAPQSPSGRGVGLEIQYHTLFGGLGRLRGLLAPSVLYRF